MRRSAKRFLMLAVLIVLGMFLLPGKLQADARLIHGSLDRETATRLTVLQEKQTWQIDFRRWEGDTYFKLQVRNKPAWIYYTVDAFHYDSTDYNTEVEIELSNSDGGYITDCKLQYYPGSPIMTIDSASTGARRYEPGEELYLTVNPRGGFGDGHFDLTVYYYEDPFNTHKDVRDEYVLELGKKVEEDFPLISNPAVGAGDNKTWYKFTTGENTAYKFLVNYAPKTEERDKFVCDVFADDEEQLERAEHGSGNPLIRVEDTGSRKTRKAEKMTAGEYTYYLFLEANTTYYIRMKGYNCDYSVMFSGFSLSDIPEDDIYFNLNGAERPCYEYDGEAKKPKGMFSIEDHCISQDGGGRPVEGADYTVSYKNNIDAGTAKVIFTGKGIITGTCEAEFTIEKAEPYIYEFTKAYTKTNVSSAFSLKAKTRILISDRAEYKDVSGILAYKSSNTKVATVSKKGKVTIKKPGTATITVSAPASKNYEAARPVRVMLTVKKAAKNTRFTYGNIKYQITKANKTVKVIGAGSKSVKKVSIPAKIKVGGVTYTVTEVGKNAFKKYSKLTTVTIGSNVKTIGASAFEGAAKLSSVTLSGKNIKSIGKNAFKGIKKTAAFTVPSAKKSAYGKLLTAKTGYKKTMKIKTK